MMNFDARQRQLVAHWWVDIGIAAGNSMPQSDRQLGKAAHKSAADAQNVNVHSHLTSRKTPVSLTQAATFTRKTDYTGVPGYGTKVASIAS
jgi:hypothetical protein